MGRLAGRDAKIIFSCMQVTDMQVYLNTWRIYVFKSVTKWKESTRDLQVFQHASKGLAEDSDCYLTVPNKGYDLERQD